MGVGGHVRGKIKTEVKDKLRAKHQELNANVRTPARYTVQQCIEDWLASLTATSSGLSCGPLLPRWARCSLVSRTEVPMKLSLPVRLPRYL
jgi:hypothetical protein